MQPIDNRDMTTRSKDGPQASISPALFLSVKGNPMCFYLRPGPTKVQLQPHIRAGGGVVLRQQEHKAILLVDPEEIDSLPESEAQRYVSTQYIKDCVERNQQLDMKDYHFTAENVRTRTQMRKLGQAFGGPRPPQREKLGRLAYTPEEDRAIMNFISKRRFEATGNRVWQLMEKQKLTNHSWQSMKYRYAKHLSLRFMDVQEEKGKATEPEQELLEEIPPAQPEPHPGPPSPPAEPQEEEEEREQEEEEAEELSEFRLQCNKTPMSSILEPSSPSSRKRGLSPEPPAQEAGPSTEPVCPAPADEPPSPKRARVEEGTGGPGLEQSEPPTTSGTAAGQQGQTPRKQKDRKLGILELASREFGDSEEEGSQSPTATPPPHALPAPRYVSDLEEFHEMESPESEPEPDPAPGHAPDPAPNANPDPAIGPISGPSAENVRPQTRSKGHAEKASSGPNIIPSRAHLFVFDNETQVERADPEEEENDVAASSCNQPIRHQNGLSSLSQTQLEEDKRRIRELMKQTNQDLIAVTKALLKSSGVFSAASRLLLDPSSAPERPYWTRHDDALLLSADRTQQQLLQEKYGQEGVAERLAFLDHA